LIILLLDDDYIITEQLKSLTQVDKSWQIVKADEVSYNKVDLVVVDTFNHKYNQILEEILKENQQIKTITVSDKLSSSFSKGCKYCNSHYNRIRLIKPIKLKVLFETIDEFDSISVCPLMDAFKNFDKLIPLIVKQFKNIFYDQEQKIISSTSDIESKEHTMQVLSLLTLLDQNEIQYTLLDESSIKLHI